MIPLKLYGLIGAVLIVSSAVGYHKWKVDSLEGQIEVLTTELARTNVVLQETRTAKELVEDSLRQVTEEKLENARRMKEAEDKRRKIATELAITTERLRRAQVPQDCEGAAQWLWEEVTR